MKNKMSNNQCYKPSENMKMVWTRFKSLNPIDSYKGLTDVLTCQKNSKKWLEDSGDICLQAYIKQNKCSEYPNKAKGFLEK